MNSININTEGYSTPNGADNLQKNWAASFAKREVNNHKTAPVLDHPDGSVTPEKLSDEVMAVIGQAKSEAENASDIAYTAKNTAEVAKDVAINAINEAISARHSASDAYSNSAIATATAEAVQKNLDAHSSNADVHITSEEKTDLSMIPVVYMIAQETSDGFNLHCVDEAIHTTAEEKADLDSRINEVQLTAVEAFANAEEVKRIAVSTDGIAIEAKETADRALQEAVVERVLDGLTEEIRITSLSIVGAYTGWQIYADGRPLSENIIPICESFVTVAGVMTGLTAGFFQNDKEIVRCKINVTEHGSVKYVNFSDYERISEKNEIEYIQKKMVGVHFGRLNSSATGAVTLTDIPDNSLILLASGEGLELNAKGQSDTLSATAKHLVLWTGSARDHEVYGITGERMTYLVYTQDMSLTNLKPYNIYTAYTKTKADAVDGDTGISIVCPVHTYIGVIGAEFPK